MDYKVPFSSLNVSDIRVHLTETAYHNLIGSASFVSSSLVIHKIMV